MRSTSKSVAGRVSKRTQLKKTPQALLSIAALAALSGTASAALNVYDSFNYSTGQLQGNTNAGGGTANGTVVQQWGCNGTNAQVWQLTATDSGYYKILTQNNTFGAAWQRPTSVIQPRFVKFSARWDF